MASANSLYFPKRLAEAYFGSGTFKMLLVSSQPSETQLDTWSFRADVSGEVTGDGYTAGGFVVVPTVGEVDAANNRAPVVFADLNPALPAATVSAVGGWIYKVGGSAETDELVQFVDFGGEFTSTNGPFSIVFNSPLYVYR